MKLSLEEAMTQKFLRPIKDLKLTHEGKKVMKKGVIFDGCDDDDDKFTIIMAVKIDLQKTAEREAAGNYIYSPTRRKFSTFIWITALVLKVARRFKTKVLLQRNIFWQDPRQKGEALLDQILPMRQKLDSLTRQSFRGGEVNIMRFCRTTFYAPQRRLKLAVLIGRPNIASLFQIFQRN